MSFIIRKFLNSHSKNMTNQIKKILENVLTIYIYIKVDKIWSEKDNEYRFLDLLLPLSWVLRNSRISRCDVKYTAHSQTFLNKSVSESQVVETLVCNDFLKHVTKCDYLSINLT